MDPVIPNIPIAPSSPIPDAPLLSSFTPHDLINSANEEIDKIYEEICQIKRVSAATTNDVIITRLEAQSTKIEDVIVNLKSGLEVEGGISHVETVARKVRRLKDMVSKVRNEVVDKIEHDGIVKRQDKIQLKKRLHVLSKQALALDGLRQDALEVSVKRAHLF